MAILVQINEDYADQFDCNKFWIFANDEAWAEAYDSALEEAKGANEQFEGSVEYSFGGNDCLIFESITAFKAQFKVTEISAQLAVGISDVLGTEFGTGPSYF